MSADAVLLKAGTIVQQLSAAPQSLCGIRKDLVGIKTGSLELGSSKMMLEAGTLMCREGSPIIDRLKHRRKRSWVRSGLDCRALAVSQALLVTINVFNVPHEQILSDFESGKFLGYKLGPAK